MKNIQFLMQVAHTIESYTKDNGFFIKFFLLDGSVNLNKWGVTKDALLRNLHTFKNTPFVITPDFGHPKAPNGTALMSIQEAYRKGNIIDVGYDEKTDRAWGIAEIKDKDAQELIKSGKIKYVSPAITFDEFALRKEGNTEIVYEFKGAHVAGVKDPAFGVLKAQIKGHCNGGEHECKRQLMMVQACTGCGTFTESDVLLAQDNECVAKWIKELSAAHPDWEHDQVVAVAFSKCREGKEGNIEKGYECPQCGMKFKTKKELDDHVDANRSEKYATVDDKWIISTNGSGNDLILSFNNGSETKRFGILTSCGNLRLDSSYKEEFKHFNSMTDNTVQKTVKVEDVEKLQTDLKSLTDKVAALEKEKKELIDKLDAERKKPIVEKIVSAKLALGKITEAQKQAEFDKLIKRDQEFLEELSSEYVSIQEARKVEDEKAKRPFTVKYNYASAIDPQKGDQVLLALRGRS